MTCNDQFNQKWALTQFVDLLVHLVLHPQGIAPTFLKLNRGRRGRVLFLFIHQGNNSNKERKK